MAYKRLSLRGEGFNPRRKVPVSITLEEKQMEQGNGKTRKRRLTAEEKWQIYQECEQPGAKVGEILRKYRLYSSDLQNIRRDVRDGALERLRQSRPGRKNFKKLAFIFALQSTSSISGYILGRVKINMLNQINNLNILWWGLKARKCILCYQM